MEDSELKPLYKKAWYQKPWYKFLLIVFVVVIIDQMVKIWVKTNMLLSEEYLVLGTWFKIHFIENDGAAFGMTFKTLFPSMTPVVAKAILSSFSVLAVGVIVYILHQIRHYSTRLPVYISFILGGAIGNIIDRLFYGMIFENINQYEGGFMFGQVVDMFYFDIWHGTYPEWIPIWGGSYGSLWPIFNIADAAISTGIVLIIVFQNKLFLQEEAPSANPDDTQQQPLETNSDHHNIPANSISTEPSASEH